MSDRDDLAILLVHGIGSQRRGDTVLDFGEPFVESLTDWLGADAVEVRGTTLLEPSPGEPAHLRLTIRRGNERKRLLVAESWWADTFNPPRWWPFVKWLLWAVPFVVFRAVDHGISVIDTNDKLDDARSRRNYLAVALYAAVRVLKNVLSVAIVLLVTAGLLLLGVLALVPRIRVALLSTQRTLLRYIGDSFYLLSSPARADATVAQVERDLAWLEREPVDKVAILAHSQGAEIAYRVLQRRTALRPIASLITFGSGIAKLRAVGRLYDRRGKASTAYLLRALAAALSAGGPVWAILAGGSRPAVAGAAAALAAAALLITAARRMLRKVVEADRLADELSERVEREKVERWLDFYATSDPVPEGPLPLQKLKQTLRAAASIRIANRRSIAHDHTSYAKNGEAFRPAVVAELAGLVGWPLSKPAMVVVNNARTRRERRTRTLVAWRLAIASLVVAALVLPFLDVGRATRDDAAEWLGEGAGRLAGLLGDEARAWIAGEPRHYVVAAAALLLAGAAVYGFGAALWDRRSRALARRLFHPSRPCGAESVGQSAPFLLRPVYSLIARYADRVDRKGGWDSLPPFRGGVVLFGLRHRLRQFNLYDTPAVDPPRRSTYTARVTERTARGTETDLCDREMGAAGSHFGRNGPAFPPRRDLPSPQEISDELLARDGMFMPARSLNMLAAAWVQFEVHDWMQHRLRSHWRPAADGALADGTAPLVRAEGSRPGSPRFVSDQTHWWDASQLYGVDARFTEKLRGDDGRVKVGDELLTAIKASQDDSPAPVPNFWLGLALFHETFAREHNAICDALEASEAGLRGDALFDKARLINAALMAKIHTVEWTPAVIAHPTTEHAIRATWWGVLREPVRKRLPRLGSGEVLSGIPGSRTHHDGVRYSLTEEFVAVYRMHPLIPETVTLRRAADGRRDGGATYRFEELTVSGGWPEEPRSLHGAIDFPDAIFSLANAYPGEISLHNFPDFLRKLPTGRGATVDLAARDIERSRETALPLYNDFRRTFRLAPAETFEDIAKGRPQWAKDLRKVYGARGVEDVDLMVGLFAERKPDGFAFSDTAFRVFLLMAARRLRSDRFFTTDFTPEVYTRTGYRWVMDRTMKAMLAEHYPELRRSLAKVENVFKPWDREIADRG